MKPVDADSIGILPTEYCRKKANVAKMIKGQEMGSIVSASHSVTGMCGCRGN